MRVLALSRRLKRAARTGEVLGTIVDDLYPNGQPYTAEDWIADNLKTQATERGGELRDSIRILARIAGEDSRKWARFHIRSMSGEDAA